MAVLPEHVRTRQCGVTTQVDLDGWGEPAQVKTVCASAEKGRLRQVHLTRHVLHPLGLARRREDADSRRIARKGRVCEGINLDNAQSHALFSCGGLALALALREMIMAVIGV